MARLSSRSASVYARHSPSRILKRNARKHKVIMETITQEKKKLRSVISFEARAPPGYTFIPAGNPHLTTECKERCRKDGLKVFAVTTTPHMHTHNLSQHVHRIGYHFPSAVVASVCMEFGLYLTPSGKTVPVQDIGNQTSRKQTNSEVDQVTINTEARDVLKDLFPNIPDNDLNQIIKTAFQKGQRKVGTAVELPLARRAQLAVVAHIRHIYTDYDRLLKTTSFHEARSTVEEPTLAKLVEWRGDDENGKTVLEDVFREVIVISDDEDSDPEADIHGPHDRDYSVEVFSSNPRVEELQTKPVNYAHPTLPDSQVDLTEDEAPPGFRFIPGVPKKNKIDRRGFSRYQAWDRALNQYRKVTNGAAYQPPSYAARQSQQENIRADKEHTPRRTMDLRHLSAAPYHTYNPRPVQLGLSRQPLEPVVEHRKYEKYEKHDIYPVVELPHKRRDLLPVSHLVPLERGLVSEQGRHSFPQHNSPNISIFVSGPGKVREKSENHSRISPRMSGPSHTRIMNPQDRVLPSIEGPLPTEIRRPNSGPIEHLAERISGGFYIRSLTPKRLTHKEFPHQDNEETTQDHTPKRRRMAYYEPAPVESQQSITVSASSNTHPGDQYSTFGHHSVQNEPHIRRRYVAPAEPVYIAEHQPLSVQTPLLHTTRFNPDTHIGVHPGPGKDHEEQLPSSSQFPLRRKSPDVSRMLPNARFAIPTGNGYDRVDPPQPPDRRDPPPYYNAHGHSVSHARPPELSESHSKPIWPSGNRERVLLPYSAPGKGKLYADDFVRTVDLRDPIVMDYQPVRHPPVPSHAIESPPQPVSLLAHDSQYRRNLSDVVPSNLSRERVPLDPHARNASQEYPVVDGRGLKYPGGLVFQSPPTPYVYEQRSQDNNLVLPTRETYEVHQRPTSDQQYRHYEKRADGPRYSMHEGRTVLLVD